MTIRAKVVADHKKAVAESKDAALVVAEGLARHAAAIETVKTLTVDGTVSFATLDAADQAKLVDALVLVSGALR